MNRLLSIIVAGLVLIAPRASADVVSTFDLGDEGWDVVDLGELGSDPPLLLAREATYRSTGGVSGGYIEAEDDDGSWWFFSAPEKFLGDLSGFFGGSISLALSAIADDGIDYPVAVLVGDGVALYAVGPPPGLAWTSYTIALDPSAWRIDGYLDDVHPTTDQFRAVLANVTAMYIDGDWLTGPDRTGLDDVRLSAVPEPSSVVALALGMSGLAGCRLRRARRRRPTRAGMPRNRRASRAGGES
ncbi:laminin B domain-containing protein [Paludisphaera mucosa]|uniref:Laminin B domain-containing protein n=1 Tax=Paludisphaera mucosa TaxID=3030827 RepID=A0ABT6FKW3_9BACT|nr:laminin B domain-containing protein [Paludisphaera mucosa]MDG3008154.1 laminin B domain-containing protein [Paludisphaera mucosa]